MEDALELNNGFVKIDKAGQTSDPKVFAIGDAVGIGLITNAIGDGKRAAYAIDRVIAGKDPQEGDLLPMVDKKRVTLAYYNPREAPEDISSCGDDCASCGKCKDCGICVAVCPEAAISRKETQSGFEYVVDENKCIGCGFCKGACPCGIWDLVPNTPM